VDCFGLCDFWVASDFQKENHINFRYTFCFH
jgi:hypothetical protein